MKKKIKDLIFNDRLLDAITEIEHTTNLCEKTINEISIIKNNLNEIISKKNQLVESLLQIVESGIPISELEVYHQKPVEMSSYINIDVYHKNETKIPYYEKMMNRMIGEIQSNRKAGNKVRILELGAGTGIFTKRMIKQIDNVEIVAIEVDWYCYNVLERTMSDYKNVTIHQEDSRIFSPNGLFDFIVSSFADHYIKQKDKQEYFDNVKANLEKEAFFIVGDEFLCEYDQSSESERIEAFTKYHNHIIKIAKSEGYKELANLERAALQSGISKDGNFMLSCNQYEEFLSKAYFKFTKEKIGPIYIHDIGGVFIYVIQDQ